MKVKITDTKPANLGDYEAAGFVEGNYQYYKHDVFGNFSIDIFINGCTEYNSTVYFNVSLPYEYISIDFLKFLKNLKTPKLDDEVYSLLIVNLDNGVLNSYEYTIKKEISNGK